MKHDSNILQKAIMSGLYITIAGAAYLMAYKLTSSKIIAGLLFSFALLIICNKGYYLYTGKIGYLIPYKKGMLGVIGKTLAGNIIAILFFGILINIANIEGFKEIANNFVIQKLSNSWYVTLILSFFCGILMYNAVDNFDKIGSDTGKTLNVVFSVVIFIILGFEHSIANIFYVVVSQNITVKVIIYLVIMLVGNGLGGILLNLINNTMKSKV